MTIYKGRVNCRKLADTIHDILVAEGYKEISTEITTNGRVYVSSSTNEDKFFIQVLDTKERYLTMGVYEEYIPSDTAGLPGTFNNGLNSASVVWNSSYNDNRFEVDYVINATNKRVLIWVSGMRAETGTMNSISYFGLPKRFATGDKDGTFAGFTMTANGYTNRYNTFNSLRSRNKEANYPYSMDYYMPGRSLGWGNKLFFSPIVVGSTAEGARGELEGIHIIERTDKNTEILHGDTFTHDGKNYMLVTPTNVGYDLLRVTYDYLIEI